MSVFAKIYSCFTQSKTSVEDWHLQVHLFSQVEKGLFKVFEADPYKHGKPKSYTVTDTVKTNLLHNKHIHGIMLSTLPKPRADCFSSDVKPPLLHCYLLSIRHSFHFKIIQCKFWTLR